MVSIVHNLKKKGIELAFDGKPESNVLQWLKDRKFRWSSFAMIWWRKYDEKIWQEAHQYFNIPLIESFIIPASKERPSAWINPHTTRFEINKKLIEKHGSHVTQESLNNQFDLGYQIEKEHTGDNSNGWREIEIAYDHLWEDPDYYTKAKPANWAEKELKKESEKPSTMKKTTMHYKLHVNNIADLLKLLKDLIPYIKKASIFSAGIGEEYLTVTGDYDKQAAMHPEISVTDFDSIISDAKGIRAKRLNAKPQPEKRWKGKWDDINTRIKNLEKVLSEEEPKKPEPKKEFFRETSIYEPEKAKKANEAARKIIEGLVQPGTIRPSFMKENIIKGREIQISMPNGEKRNGQFVIVELDNIIASHNEENFHSEPLYPKNASGNNINDRNYKDDLSAQKAVMDYAKDLEPESLITTSRTPSGTPIITTDGFVVSGNNRTMSLKLAAKNYPDNYKEYIKYLAEEIESYGFERSFIHQDVLVATDKTNSTIHFSYPVLVRIDYDFPEYTTQELSKYNKDTKKSERPVDKAIKLSNILRENTRCAEIIAEITGEYETFSEFYVSIPGQKKLAKTLVECNLLTSQELPAYFSETTFTEQGKEFVENLLAALILDREALLATEQPGVKATRQKLITSLPVLMKNASLPEGSLKKNINDAVILQQIIKASGNEFADFIRQQNLFGTKYDRKTVYLNRLVDSGKLKFKQAIEGYNDAILKNQGVSLFGEKPSLDEIFDHWIKGGVTETDQRLIEASHIIGKEHPEFDKEYLEQQIEKATPNLSKIKDVDVELAEIRGEETDIESVINDLNKSSDELHKINIDKERKEKEPVVNEWIYNKFIEFANSKQGTVYNQQAVDYVMQFLPKLTNEQELTLGTQIYYCQAKKRFLKNIEAENKLYTEGWKRLESNVVKEAIEKGYYLKVKMYEDSILGGTIQKEEILKPFIDAEKTYWILPLKATRKGYNVSIFEARPWYYKFVNKETKQEIEPDKDFIKHIIVGTISKVKNQYNKQYLRDQEGLKIYLVDGEAVRKDHIEFVSGGHDYVYDWIPKGEVWIDDNQRSKPDDMEATIKHELFEIKKMRDEGLSYDDAHELANKVEKEVRNKEEVPLSKIDLLRQTKYIETGETRTDNNYEPSDPEYNQRFVYKPIFVNEWYYADNTDPDTELFDDIEKAIADLREPGSYDETDKYFEPYKETRLILLEQWIDKNDNVVEEFGRVSYDDWADKNETHPFVEAFGSDSLIDLDTFDNREKSSEDLLNEVYFGINKDIIKEYQNNDGTKLAISILESSGKYRTIQVEDSDENEIGSIKLRISDHSYNPANNGPDEQSGNFISIEIANKNETAGRFRGKFGIQFTGEDSYNDVIDAVNERVKEIIDGWDIKERNKESKSNTDEIITTDNIPFLYHDIRSYWGSQSEDNFKKQGFISIKEAYPIVTEKDYWLATDGTFEQSSKEEFEKIEAPLIKSPNTSSIYKVKDGILYRGSDHWGKVATCNWYYPKELNIGYWNEHNYWYFKIPLSKLRRNNNIVVKNKEPMEPEKKLRPYIAFFNSKQYELYAENLWDAKKKAIEHFKPTKSKEHLVSVHLAVEDDKPVKSNAPEKFGRGALQNEFLANIRKLRPFISGSQIEAMGNGFRGEEYEFFANKATELADLIEKMPKSYETEETKTPEKIVYLHYFKGGSDWYIIEKDKGSPDDPVQAVQSQAYGYAVLNGDWQNAEWGYVSIEDLKQENVELDFYWTPKPFKEIKKVQDEPDERSDDEERKIFGYSFMFDPANKEGNELITALQGFGMVIGIVDAPNVITIEYRTEKYEMNDNSGEFKLNRIGSEGYPYVIDFKDNNGRLKEIFALAKEVEDNIIADQKKKPEKTTTATQEDVDSAKVSQPPLIREYENDFERNKAIEKILDRKWNDKPDIWFEDQLEFIKGYSGYGGLDEFGEITKGSLFEFYTPEKVIEKMWGLAYKYGYKDGRICEPSAGIGLFFKREYVKSYVIKDAYEINKYSAKIIRLLYPETNVNDGLETKYFEQLFIKNNYTVRDKVSPVHSLVIGNPPYGEAQGLYMGMGEKTYTHARNYIDYFIFRGLDLLVKDGLLIYIIGAEVAAGGKPWLDQGTSKCKELIAQKGKLIDAYRLPEGLFARTNVVSDIIVMKKK